jgi:hypothetical protein
MDLNRSFTPTLGALISGRQNGLPSPAWLNGKGEIILKNRIPPLDYSYASSRRNINRW